MKIIFRLILTSLLLAVLSFAETAIVKRNVTLRPDPSSDNQAITTLGPGQRVAGDCLRKRCPNQVLRALDAVQLGP
jgi:hypothetical protein